MKVNFNVVCGLIAALCLSVLVATSIAQTYRPYGKPDTCTEDHCSCGRSWGFTLTQFCPPTSGCSPYITNDDPGRKECCQLCDLGAQEYFYIVEYADYFCFYDCDANGIYTYHHCNWLATATNTGNICTRA